MTSTWDIKQSKKYPKLEENTEADVVVVGGGLAGMWCAYFLSASGKRVVVLEKGRVGSGATRYTTAFITQALDTPITELVEMFGPDVAQDLWRSGREAMQLIENVVAREGIVCEFERTSLYVHARDTSEYRELVSRHLTAERLGFETKLEKGADLGFRHEGVFELPYQAKFHPSKFLEGLTRACVSMGVEIYEKTEARDVVGNAPVRVVTKDGKIVSAGDVVLATYDPLGNPRSTKLKKGMYTSYVLELAVPRDKISPGMYIDMSNPYHYIRVDDMGQKKLRMLVGGADHRAELPVPEDKHYKALRSYVRRLIPDMPVRTVLKWRGPIMEPSDGLALIGETTPRHYVATAFSGNGMTYSALAGWIISDLITGRDNPYKDLYDPKRRLDVKAVLYKARDYTAEFFGGAVKNIFK